MPTLAPFPPYRATGQPGNRATGQPGSRAAGQPQLRLLRQHHSEPIFKIGCESFLPKHGADFPNHILKKKMKKDTIVTLCTIASIGTIVVGFALILATVGPHRTSEWGEEATKAIPQAILVFGGLLALAICSFSAND